MQWLTADDDNGNLNDGTPHMTAIFDAFNRHGIACATPAPTNSGCAGGPSAAATLNGTPGNYQVALVLERGPRRDPLLGLPHRGPRRLRLRQGAHRRGHRHHLHRHPGGERPAVLLQRGGRRGLVGLLRARQQLRERHARRRVADYSLSCNPSAPDHPPGRQRDQHLHGALRPAASRAAVGLSCAGLPAGRDLRVQPAVGDAASRRHRDQHADRDRRRRRPAGTYNFQAQGTSGASTRTFNMALTVNAQSVVPTALAVDAAGNGVFQPNETAVMTPDLEEHAERCRSR